METLTEKNSVWNKICRTFENLNLSEMVKTIVNTKTDNNLEKLKGVLFKMQLDLDDLKNEVDKSYALLEIGEKTSLTKKLEQSFENPIKDIFNFSNRIDNKVNFILDKVIRGFFKHNKINIEKVYKTRKGLNDLHYSIILKKDSTKERDLFFNFINQLNLTDIHQTDNIFFQFIPQELMNRVSFDEEINIG